MRKPKTSWGTIAFLIVIFLSFNGCSVSNNPIESELEEILEESEEIKEEVKEEEEAEAAIGNLTAVVNGQDFSATRLIVGPWLGASVSFTDNGYLFAISAVDWQPSLESNKIIYLIFFDFDFDDVVPGLKVDTPNPLTILASEAGAYAVYAEDPNTEDDIDGTGTETIEEISIEITAIDREKQLISGKFSFRGTHEDTTTIFNVTEGVFTDVAYEVQ